MAKTNRRNERMEETKQEFKKDMSWLKGLLNNMPLLKWVKKFSADRLMEDNRMAEGFGIAVSEDSITVADDTMTKILTTSAQFKGKEIVRFSLNNIGQVIKLLGDDGKLIITDCKHKEMVIQMGNTCIVVCPLPKGD